VVGIAAGLLHNLALRDDGTVFAWGYNDYGQRDVPCGVSNVVAIAAGFRHSVALKGDGRVVAWGATCCASELSRVPEGLEEVVAIAAGDYHTLALRADGTVVVWGAQESPATTVPEGLTNAVAMAVGVQHSVALRVDGTVAVWGGNYYGQTNLPGLLTGVVAIGSGHDHNLVLCGGGQPIVSVQPVSRSAFLGRRVHFYAQAVGELPLQYQWQFNNLPISGATNPVLTLFGTGWSDAGDYRLVVTNALGATTSAWVQLSLLDAEPFIVTPPESQKVLVGQPAWFRVVADGSGPLQYQWRREGVEIPGATNSVLEFGPAQILQAGNYSVVVSNAVDGVVSSSATLEVSQVAMWGDYYTPPISGLTNVVAIAGGPNHHLALHADGTVVAWGCNEAGQTNVPSGLTKVVAVAAGEDHSLALRADGTVVGWGSGNVAPPNLSNVVAISAGGHLCLALRADGTVAAWGDDECGQLQVPAEVTNVIALHTFGGHCLALRGDHTVVAWGNNEYGQASVPPGLREVVAVAANNIFSLALKSDGTLVGWGCNESWGDMAIPAAATNVVAISGGGSPHYLVLKQDGTALAWGYDEFGAERVPDGLTGMVEVAAGGFYNIALMGDTAPFLVAPPVGRKVLAGMNVTFYAQATGVRPMGYQWYFNGAALSGATDAWLTRLAVSTSEGGIYTLVVSNALGVVTSTPAMLSVTPLDQAPVILFQPEDQLAGQSGDATFEVQAGGAQPLSYQWQFNGGDRLGATNATLHLTNLNVADMGFYRVRITNVFGENLSAGAFLTVLDYGAALNTTDLVWVSSLGSFWVVDPWATHDGILSARAGGRKGDTASYLQTTVTGPGVLTFWWKANPMGSSLAFRMDDAGQPFYYQGGDWQQRGIMVPAGDHALAWWCESEGWLDQVAWQPGTNLPPAITLPPASKATCRDGSVTFEVEAVGTPPLQYQWQFNGVNLADATSQTLTLPQVLPEQAGRYAVVVRSDYGAVTSLVAELHLLPLAYWGLSHEWLKVFPLCLTNAVALAAGGNHSLALIADGTVAAWGFNDQWQAVVPPGLSNVVAISAGCAVSLALKADGRVVAWGYRAATNVPSDLGEVIAISAGGYHGLALKADGTVRAWGYHSPNQTRIPEGLRNVVAIVAGCYHNLALKADGTVAVWGESDSATPAPPDLTNAIAVAAGFGHSLALRADGTVVAWGGNAYGQTNVPANVTNVVAIAAGYANCLARRADGTVAGWGDNTHGQRDYPEGLETPVTMAAGWYHGLALLGNASASPRLFQPTREGNSFKLALPTERGKSYRLEYKNSLAEPQWILQPAQAGDGGVKVFTDPDAGGAQRFYRVYQQH
jgi:alpha-tubulin suppressor-like RCC1 family protein